MKLLQTSNFCGCTDLRTGALIIGYLSLLVDIINVTLLGNHWATSVISVVTTIPMLYGIHSNRSPWMIPGVVCFIVELLLCLVGVIFVIPICSLFFWDETKESFIKIAQGWLELDTTDTTVIMITLWLTLTIFTVIQWYFTAVLCSCYKLLRDQNQPNSNASYNVAGQV